MLKKRTHDMSCCDLTRDMLFEVKEESIDLTLRMSELENDLEAITLENNWLNEEVQQLKRDVNQLEYLLWGKTTR